MLSVINEVLLMKRYSLYRGRYSQEQRLIEETILLDFTQEQLFASSVVPQDLYDTVLRVIDYIESTFAVNGVEFTLGDSGSSFILEKSK